jgi:hypothetical protein
MGPLSWWLTQKVKVCHELSRSYMVMEGRSGANNKKQQTIQKSLNIHYPCCIQPWKSINTYVLFYWSPNSKTNIFPKEENGSGQHKKQQNIEMQ